MSLMLKISSTLLIQYIISEFISAYLFSLEGIFIHKDFIYIFPLRCFTHLFIYTYIKIPHVFNLFVRCARILKMISFIF